MVGACDLAVDVHTSRLMDLPFLDTQKIDFMRLAVRIKLRNYGGRGSSFEGVKAGREGE